MKKKSVYFLLQRIFITIDLEKPKRRTSLKYMHQPFTWNKK